MIPIVAIGNLASAIIATIITGVIILRLRAASGEGPLIKNFLVFFILLSLFFWLAAAPGTFVRSTVTAGYVIRMANALIIVAAAYFLAIPLAILNMKKTNQFLIPLIIFLAVILFSIDSYLYKASELKEVGRFLIYHVQQRPFVRIFEGIVTMSVALIGSLFFFISGKRLTTPEHKKLKTRSYLLGSGMLLLMVAAFLNYLIFTTTFNSGILLLSSIIALIGIITMGGGILLIQSRQEKT